MLSGRAAGTGGWDRWRGLRYGPVEDGQQAQRAAGVDVVALVTSAGGLDALSAVLGQLPPDLPAAVVVQQHLSGRGSQLVAILRRRTGHRVEWAEDGAGAVVTAPRPAAGSPAS